MDKFEVLRSMCYLCLLEELHQKRGTHLVHQLVAPLPGMPWSQKADVYSALRGFANVEGLEPWSQ